MFQLHALILGFEYLKSLYHDDDDLCDLYFMCLKHKDFLVQGAFLFKGIRLCILKCSTRELLIKGVHGGSLAGHFGESKTLTILKEHYYWLGMEKDVQDIL